VNLLDFLASTLDVRTQRIGGRVVYHIPCPHCGKAVAPRQTHCSFSERGYWCFVCRKGGSLVGLAHHYKLDVSHCVGVGFVPRVIEPPPWAGEAAELLAAYAAHPDRRSAWAGHKGGVPAEVLDAYGLGVGRLPGSPLPDRLIVPVFDRGRCVGLHGRAYLPTDTGPKWATAVGTSKSTQLLNADRLTRRGEIVVCENLVDAILLTEHLNTSGLVAVSGGGAVLTRDHARIIARSIPKAVLVLFDNDEAGRTGAREALALLRENDVIARAYTWPTNAPDKADVGWWLTTQRSQ